MPEFPAPTPTLCDNCGRADDDLAPVRRVYLTPEAWDTAGSATTVDEVERWCFSCRTQYPHEDASEGD